MSRRPQAPWAITHDERRVRRALRTLTPEQRAICAAVADGENPGYTPTEVKQALRALLDAYSQED